MRDGAQPLMAMAEDAPIFQKIITFKPRMKVLFYLLMILILLPSCKGSSGYTAKVVKPKYHHRWFDRGHRRWYDGKSDKRLKRTKVVKMK
jgi:hypothetical protein